MPLSNSMESQYKAWGVPVPSSQGHGTEDDIRKHLNTQGEREHSDWIQVGPYIHCNSCQHGHGFSKAPFENGKHWMLDGVDADGHPQYREIHPKPNNWKPSDTSKA